MSEQQQHFKKSSTVTMKQQFQQKTRHQVCSLLSYTDLVSLMLPLTLLQLAWIITKDNKHTRFTFSRRYYSSHNNNNKIDSYSLNTKRNSPPKQKDLVEFEKNLLNIIHTTKLKKSQNIFWQYRIKDFNRIKYSTKILTKANNSRFFWMELKIHNKLTSEAATKN